MAGKQVKVLSTDNVSDLLAFARCTRIPMRNEVIVLLSAKAGLRAGEIAKLTLDMMLDSRPRGLGNKAPRQPRKQGGRRISIHPELRAALIIWRAETSAPAGFVITSERGSGMMAV